MVTSEYKNCDLFSSPWFFCMFYSLYNKCIPVVKPKKNKREETKSIQISGHTFLILHTSISKLLQHHFIHNLYYQNAHVSNSHYDKMKRECAKLFYFMFCNLIRLWSNYKLLHNDGFFQMCILDFPKSNPYLITYGQFPQCLQLSPLCLNMSSVCW